MTEEEEMAAMGKNAFMPQPLPGKYTLHSQDHQYQHFNKSDNHSRQPNFESVTKSVSV